MSFTLTPGYHPVAVMLSDNRWYDLADPDNKPVGNSDEDATVFRLWNGDLVTVRTSDLKAIREQENT